MNLYIKQKVFSFGDSFTIYNEQGDPCFLARGEVFSLGKRLHITDLAGNELALIQQKLFSFLPKYYISRGGRDVAEVVKHFTFFKQEYSVNGFGWSIQGDFFAHEYEIYCGDVPAVTVSKQWFTWGDTYEIAVAPGIDPIDALAVVLVIDACNEASAN